MQPRPKNKKTKLKEKHKVARKLLALTVRPFSFVQLVEDLFCFYLVQFSLSGSCYRSKLFNDIYRERRDL